MEMRYLKPRSGTFYCFSPPVMIATFFIEMVLAVHTLVRYKLSAVTRLAAGILLCLGVFQLAEYNICEGAFGLDGLAWARVGFVAITLLPPMGLHLATKLAKNKQTALVAGSYTMAAAFAGYFMFVSHGLSGPACMGNYVIFQIAQGAGGLYTLYYYGLLAVAVSYAWYQSTVLRPAHKAHALRALAIGYLAFMIPTTAANIVSPETIRAIPSIMCGFAVVLAIVLAGEVLPQYHKVETLTRFVRGRFSFGR